MKKETIKSQFMGGKERVGEFLYLLKREKKTAKSRNTRRENGKRGSGGRKKGRSCSSEKANFRGGRKRKYQGRGKGGISLLGGRGRREKERLTRGCVAHQEKDKKSSHPKRERKGKKLPCLGSEAGKKAFWLQLLIGKEKGVGKAYEGKEEKNRLGMSQHPEKRGEKKNRLISERKGKPINWKKGRTILCSLKKKRKR